MTAGPSTTLLPVPTTEEPSTTTTTEAPTTTTSTTSTTLPTTTSSTSFPVTTTSLPVLTVPDLSEPTVPTSTTAVVTVPTTVPAATAGGGAGVELSTEAKLALIIGALLLVAAVLTAFTVHYWRVTKPAA